MSGTALEDIKVDVDALGKKYAEERAKRIRTDAANQYAELKGKFANFATDPNADPAHKRDAVVEDCDVLIIGGGFSGLLSGGHMRERGVKDIRIVEKGADFGGTWYWNRYPGAACDVESYIYLPLLEETGFIPSEKYSKGQEIFGYCQQIGRHFDLYKGALFQTEVRTVEWDAKRHRWIVSTDRGDKLAARWVLSCTGFLFNPKLPGIPGIQDFEGHMFHTSRWDYDYTGGDQTGNLTGLKDKRVGIIGTGSTGIQAIPILGQYAKQLYVFQRTPSTIDPRGNKPTDPEWAKSLEAGWHRARMDNFNAVTLEGYQGEDLVDDGWCHIVKETAPPAIGETGEVDMDKLVHAQFARMEKTRQWISSVVDDQETAEALKPYYNYFCKRPCFHDDYLPTFNRPNVKLVDTKGMGVERITKKGVVVDGVEYELDLLIFATGFDFFQDFGRQTGIDVIGKGGQHLADKWADGMRSMWGTHTRGFPNFCFITAMQAGTTFNYVDIADTEARHVAYTVAEALKRDYLEVEPTQTDEDDWVQQVVDAGKGRLQFLDACTPGYYNFEGEGTSNRKAELNNFYCGSGLGFMKMLKDWRDKGDFDKFEVNKG
jgi:cyclohexanone monooxygenase